MLRLEEIQFLSRCFPFVALSSFSLLCNFGILSFEISIHLFFFQLLFLCICRFSDGLMLTVQLLAPVNSLSWLFLTWSSIPPCIDSWYLFFWAVFNTLRSS